MRYFDRVLEEALTREELEHLLIEVMDDPENEEAAKRVAAILSKEGITKEQVEEIITGLVETKKVERSKGKKLLVALTKYGLKGLARMLLTPMRMLMAKGWEGTTSSAT